MRSHASLEIKHTLERKAKVLVQVKKKKIGLQKGDFRSTCEQENNKAARKSLSENPIRVSELVMDCVTAEKQYVNNKTWIADKGAIHILYQ